MHPRKPAQDWVEQRLAPNKGREETSPAASLCSLLRGHREGAGTPGLQTAPFLSLSSKVSQTNRKRHGVTDSGIMEPRRYRTQSGGVLRKEWKLSVAETSQPASPLLSRSHPNYMGAFLGTAIIFLWLHYRAGRLRSDPQTAQASM